MNKILSYLKLYFLAPIKTSFARFPEIFVELALLAGVLIYDNRVNVFTDAYRRIINSITIGLFVLIIYHISLVLISEKYKLSKLTRALIGVGVVLFATLWGVYNYSQWSLMNNFFLSFRNTTIVISGITLFLVSPYLIKRNNFTVYLPYILTRALVTIFYTGTLILGTIGIISLFSFLFELNINTDLYTDIVILFSTLVGGPLFLGNIPLISKNLNLKDYGIVWKVLIVRIVIPLASIATLIIFAYATIGRLSGVYDGGIFLVSAFSSLTTILIGIVLSEPFEKEIGYIKLFRKYAPFPMLLLVANLGVELLLEINKSGLLVDNFMIGLFTDFFAGAFLLLLLKRYYKPIFIPLLLSGTLLVAGFTPLLNIEAWSLRAASSQLTNTLSELNMLDNNQVIPRTDLTNEQKERISKLLAEFANYHGFEDVDYLPADFSVDKTINVFGFDYYFGGGDNSRFLSLGTDYAQGYDISGFDRSYDVFIFKGEASNIGSYVTTIELNKIVIKQNSTTLATLDLEAKILALYQLHGNRKFEISNDELIFVFDNNQKFKLLIKNLTATINPDDSVVLDSIAAILLVKE
jgi:hypothetical protein